MMMTDPIFPEVVIGPATYIVIGILLATVVFLLGYIYRIKTVKKNGLDVKQLKMPESRIIILETILESGGKMQTKLPEESGFSKSTVSQALSELRSQDLIIKKKRGNSYFIEPNIVTIEEQVERKEKN